MDRTGIGKTRCLSPFYGRSYRASVPHVRAKAVLPRSSKPAVPVPDWKTSLVRTIDSESITAELDVYHVTRWADGFADNPIDDYDHVTSIVLNPPDRGHRDYRYGPDGK